MDPIRGVSGVLKIGRADWIGLKRPKVLAAPITRAATIAPLALPVPPKIADGRTMAATTTAASGTSTNQSSCARLRAENARSPGLGYQASTSTIFEASQALRTAPVKTRHRATVRRQGTRDETTPKPSVKTRPIPHSILFPGTTCHK